MNRLAGETSPYLLQHAHNPVDWFPWGDEALGKARTEDKPLLVSIGYAACHWCHVMEKESFEDPVTADIMNRNFVNVKIDREERPDLDHIYMEAVQLIAGSGGWPLNVFLTPEAKPFYGGTYFPPRDGYGRPSWKTLLEHIASVYRNQRDEVNRQAESLTNHIAGTNSFGIKSRETGAGNVNPGNEDALLKGPGIPAFKKGVTEAIFENLMRTADRKDGGFGQAPKFPQTFSIRYLLQHYYYTRNAEALDQALLSLDKMIFGGIYDQLGGGFARYSTDKEWLAPHFEKMLYDNALLVTAISEAWQISKKPHYRETIIRTMEFLKRELRSPENGFYSSLDADSEGEEGKYYVWTRKEADALLGKDSGAFAEYYDITEKGNWEGKNILRVRDPANPLPPEIDRNCREKLLKAREQRTRPMLDDKILLGWNALVIIACCKAFAALGTEEYRRMALETMAFIGNRFKGEGIFHYYHSYKEGKAGIPAFLDDYACLIAAHIELQEITGDAGWLKEAERLARWVVKHFSEEETGYFFYTHVGQDDVIVRKKELYDGAIPSGNAVMAANLLYLGIALDIGEWRERSFRLCEGLEDAIVKYPGSFGVWATLVNACTYAMNEIVLGGGDKKEEHLGFLAHFIPNRIFQLTSGNQPDFPLLRNKPVSGKPQFFLCRNYSCQQPVTELNEFLRLVETT